MGRLFLDKHDNQLDRIINWLQRPIDSIDDDLVVLTQKDQEILDRLLTLHELRRKYLQKARVIPMYMRVADVSKSQAYLDWKKVEYVMGSFEQANKQFLRALYTEKLESYAAKADAQGDFKTAAMAIEKAAKINRLDQEEVERPPYEEFVVDQPTIGFYPGITDSDKIDDEEMIKTIKDLAGKSREKMRIRLLQNTAEDVDFTESNEQEGTP